MLSRDQRAIQAAYHTVTTVNWIVANPTKPVPTSLLRPMMESFADYCGDEFLARLKHNVIKLYEQPEPEPSTEEQRDEPTEHHH